MRRLALPIALLAGLGTACRTAGPEAPAGFADPGELMRPYLGELMVLRHGGDEEHFTVRRGRAPSGTCDVAVRVDSVAFDGGEARFTLETLGMPSVKGRAARCQRPRPEVRLVLADFPASPDPADLSARVDAVLQAPAAYLAAKGVPFDLEPGEEPEEIASPSAGGDPAEAIRGRRVTQWQELLLSVEAWYRDPSGNVRHHGEVEAAAIVGPDGRLHRTRVLTSLTPEQSAAVVASLALWRFAPAREGDQPVAARVELRPVLRIY